MNITKQKINGFTLIEMLLVLVIASSILVMGLNYSQVKMDQIRRERTAIQMEGILNAAASYYVVNSSWPTIAQLQSGGYLPSTTFKSGWGDTISAGTTGTNLNTYYVQVTFAKQTAAKNNGNAQVLAGMLPLGSYSGAQVDGYINVPGQNLNNATAVNFGAVYYSGSCVPAPTCPTGMSPQIMVIPVSATGVTGNPTCGSTTDPTTCTQVPTSPMNSFTAYFRGASTTSDTPVQGSPPAPADCEITNGPANHTFPCDFGSNGYSSTTYYWRVCIGVATNSGVSYPASSDSNSYNEGKLTGSVLAITRCAPTNGDVPAGSSGSGSHTVWTPNNNWVP